METFCILSKLFKEQKLKMQALVCVLRLESLAQTAQKSKEVLYDKVLETFLHYTYASLNISLKALKDAKQMEEVQELVSVTLAAKTIYRFKLKMQLKLLAANVVL